MSSICYLCGKEIGKGVASKDHVVPRQFIRRKQPKMRGFDYTGVLPTHEECNNKFGAESERMCQKSLQLIDALSNPECYVRLQHRDKREIEIMGFDADCLPGFTESDREFFRFIDVRSTSIEELRDTEFYKGKRKTNLHKQILNIALSVLAKSAAAVLVKRFDTSPRTWWRILCIPYHGVSPTVDFDGLLGKTKPFEVGVKLWIRPYNNKDWFGIYKNQGALVYVFFGFRAKLPLLKK